MSAFYFTWLHVK